MIALLSTDASARFLVMASPLSPGFLGSVDTGEVGR